jgi:hypothetical protein
MKIARFIESFGNFGKLGRHAVIPVFALLAAASAQANSSGRYDCKVLEIDVAGNGTEHALWVDNSKSSDRALLKGFPNIVQVELYFGNLQIHVLDRETQSVRISAIAPVGGLPTFTLSAFQPHVRVDCTEVK